MDLSSLATDNVTEVLELILAFTRFRETILTRNISQVNRPNFKPMDLDVETFTQHMSQAIDEHLKKGRLLLCDDDLFQFGAEGSFQCSPVVDYTALAVFKRSVREYVTLQMKKLAENSMNRKIASELMRRKRCQATS